MAAPTPVSPEPSDLAGFDSLSVLRGARVPLERLGDKLDPQLRADILVDARESLPVMSPVNVLNKAAVILVVAFLVTLVATPLARRLALRRGIVDRPTESRKIHREPIPYLGGLAVFAGMLVAMVLARMLGDLDLGYAVMPIGITVGMIAIMLAGLGDDVGGWDPRTKIAGQLVAAAGLAISEIGIEAARGGLFPIFERIKAWRNYTDDSVVFEFLGEVVSWSALTDGVSYWAGVALIAIFVLGFTNATNFIDGLDGLCSGVVGIFAVGILVVSVLLVPLGTRIVDREEGAAAYVPVQVDLEDAAAVEQAYRDALMAGPWDSAEAVPPDLVAELDHPMIVARVVLAVALLGAVLGFLPWNFNPAVIFLGDCGSLMLGYLCAVLILMLGDAGRTDFVLAGLIIFALPIMDMVLAIVRRRLAGVSLTAADSEHLHHQARRAFGSVRRAVLLLYGVAAMFAALGAGLVALVMADVQARVIYAVAIIFFGFVGVLALKAARHRASAAAAAS
jgi:UDP-GlcNAc:undecaprenyl-phosphate GlcNAc-1-phosphate transferase